MKIGDVEQIVDFFQLAGCQCSVLAMAATSGFALFSQSSHHWNQVSHPSREGRHCCFHRCWRFSRGQLFGKQVRPRHCILLQSSCLKRPACLPWRNPITWASQTPQHASFLWVILQDWLASHGLSLLVPTHCPKGPSMETCQLLVL